MSSYGLSVLPSLFAAPAPGPFSINSAQDPALRSPIPRALSPSPSLFDHDQDGDDGRDRRLRDRRTSADSSSSSDDNHAASTRHARTSPDFSSLTPHASAPTSPSRAPGLFNATPRFTAHTAALSRASAGPSSAASSALADDDEEEEEDGGDLPTLPMRVPRPKTKADRDRERALGLVKQPGQKREGLGVKLARKRANSLKWAKYADVGAFEVELGLSNDDLKRN